MFHMLLFPVVKYLYLSHEYKQSARPDSCMISVVVEVDTESCVETSVLVEVER